MFTIRPYRTEDRERVERRFAQLSDYEHTLDKFTNPGESVAAPHMDWLLAECAQNQGAIFVAETEGVIVGFVSTYVEHEQDISVNLSEYLHICDLIVTAEHRGRGIGSALLAQAEAYAREIGQKVIKLNVLANNEDALSVYRRFGLKAHMLTMLKELD
jgi:ribosomal protein S18 acetylase RimI-like enzyme